MQQDESSGGGPASTPELLRRQSASGVTLDDFIVHGQVGEGEFGKVMMAAKREGADAGRMYAMKVLRKDNLLFRGSSSITQAITEKQVLQEMSAKPHPFIVSLNYAFQDADHLFLVLDFVGGGDLFSLLEQKQRFPEGWVMVYSAEIVLALEHVHEAGIIFRDLKPENVMVGMDGHLKLTDFGMSKKAHGATTGTICGTPEYLAPEVLQGRPYDSAVDWWTLGCLVYEMLVGRSPFKSEDMAAMVQQIISDKVSVPAYASDAVRDVILGLLHQEPSRRLGAEAAGGVAFIKQHPFYTELDWAALYNKEVPSPTSQSLKESSRATPTNEGGAGGDGVAGGAQAPGQTEAERLAREFTAFAAPEGSPGPSSGAATASRRSPADLSPPQGGTIGRVSGGGASSGGAPPALDRQDTTSRAVHSLTMELTADGTLWRVSDPLARLLGYARGRQHELIGHKLLDPSSSMIEQETDRIRFAAAFSRLQRQLNEMDEMSAASERLSMYDGAPFFDIDGADEPVGGGGGAMLVHGEPSPPIGRSSRRNSLDAERPSPSKAGGAGGGATLTNKVQTSSGLAHPRAMRRNPNAGGKSGSGDEMSGSHSSSPLLQSRSPTEDAPPTMPLPAWSSRRNSVDAELQPPPPRDRSGSMSGSAGGASGASGGGGGGIPRINSVERKKEEQRERRHRGRLNTSQEAAVLQTAEYKSSRPINVHVKTKDGRRLCLRCVLDAAPPPPEDGLDAILARASILVTITDMTLSEANMELVRRRYAVSYNDKLPDADVTTLFSSRMTYNKAGTQAPLSAAAFDAKATGMDVYLDRRRCFVRAFPDMHFTILEQNSQGDDQVFTSWQWTGTHLGPYHYRNYEGEYADIPPSGCRVALQGIALDVCRGGKIVDHAAYYDEADIRNQLQHSKGGKNSETMYTQLITKPRADGHVRCILHVAPIGAPRPDEQQLNAQATMQRFYARKYLRQLAAFGADGFALCKACVDGAPVVLCTHAFARVFEKLHVAPLPGAGDGGDGRPGMAQSLLNASLLELLEPLSENTPQLLSQLEATLRPGGTKAAPKRIATSVPRRAIQEVLHAQCADGSTMTLILSLAPLEHDNKSYWAVLLIDVGAEMRRAKDPSSAAAASTASSTSTSAAAGAKGGGGEKENSAGGVPLQKTLSGGVGLVVGGGAGGGGASGGGGGGGGGGARIRLGGLKSTTRSFGSLFVHRLPASWTWFDSRLMEEVLTAALHALNVAFSMVDMQAEDQPMVWLSRGFERMTGLSRNEASGRNCRYLQTDGTDPASIAQMKGAITAGEPTRVYIWNRGPSLEHGFWNLIALYPGYDEGAQGQEGTGELRYYAGLSVSLSSQRLRKVTRLTPQIVGHNAFSHLARRPPSPPNLPPPLLPPSLDAQQQPPPSTPSGSTASFAITSPATTTAAAAAGTAAGTAAITTATAAATTAATAASDDALGVVLGAWRKAYEAAHGRPPTRDEMRRAMEASIDASFGGGGAAAEGGGATAGAAGAVGSPAAGGAAPGQPWVVDLSALRGPRNSF